MCVRSMFLAMLCILHQTVVPILYLCILASGLEFGRYVSPSYGELVIHKRSCTVYGSYVHVYIVTRECVHVH